MASVHSALRSVEELPPITLAMAMMSNTKITKPKKLYGLYNILLSSKVAHSVFSTPFLHRLIAWTIDANLIVYGGHPAHGDEMVVTFLISLELDTILSF